ncbi:hypothetical protein B0O80DRAFT_237989 [Mortierella sp. GBAus27b]|nr:hypothetical protein B0O80DRAFT_237989 [Mortierella sp. GBAus27b]
MADTQATSVSFDCWPFSRHLAHRTSPALADQPYNSRLLHLSLFTPNSHLYFCKAATTMEKTLIQSRFVKRPAFGRIGQPVTVRSNFFEITEFNNTTVHHYDVSITPDTPPPVCRRLYEQLVRVYGRQDFGGARPVFDGRKNLFSPRELPFQSRTFEVCRQGRPQSSRVK